MTAFYRSKITPATKATIPSPHSDRTVGCLVSWRLAQNKTYAGTTKQKRPSMNCFRKANTASSYFASTETLFAIQYKWILMSRYPCLSSSELALRVSCSKDVCKVVWATFAHAVSVAEGIERIALEVKVHERRFQDIFHTDRHVAARAKVAVGLDSYQSIAGRAMISTRKRSRQEGSQWRRLRGTAAPAYPRSSCVTACP